MAKLKHDLIEWILKLISTQAQEEYHKLEKANRELKKENDATRKAMEELEGAVLKFAKAVGTDLASASAFTGAPLRFFEKNTDELSAGLKRLQDASVEPLPVLMLNSMR